MNIEYANKSDLEIINQHDEHITKEELSKSILIAAKEDNEMIRYNLESVKTTETII